MKAIVVAAVLLAVTVTLSSARAQASAALPDTPAGRSLAELLQAWRAADRPALERFFERRAEEREPAERTAAIARRVAWTANLVHAYPDIEALAVERSAQREIAIVCRSRVTEAWCRLELEEEATAPHAVGLGFSYMTPPREARTSRRLARSSVAAEADAYVKRLVAHGRFSGVVAIATNGMRWFQRAYGSVMDVEQPFALGSMSKMFTAVAIAQLAQQGKLRFDDPIARHLPDFASPDVARRVTIEHLLMHSGGLGDFLEDTGFQAARAAGTRFASAADYLRYVHDERPAFEPGSRFLYSNSGYVVLGAIVERASNLNYFDYIVEHVLRPAGMRRTDPRGIRGSPAGSAISTAGDLVRFAHALQTHRLLDAGHTKIVLAPRIETPFGNSYGFGFFVRNRGTPERIVGHDGEAEGVNALLDVYVEEGHAVVVLADRDPPAARNVGSKLETLLLVR